MKAKASRTDAGLIVLKTKVTGGILDRLAKESSRHRSPQQGGWKTKLRAVGRGSGQAAKGVPQDDQLPQTWGGRRRKLFLPRIGSNFLFCVVQCQFFEPFVKNLKGELSIVDNSPINNNLIYSFQSLSDSFPKFSHPNRTIETIMERMVIASLTVPPQERTSTS